MSKQSDTTRESTGPLDTEAVLRRTARKLEGMLRSVGGHGAGEHEATVKSVARLATALTAVCGELRQHAKGRRRALEEFGLDDIVAHLRELPKSQRDRAFELAFEASGSEPLL